MPLLWKEVLSKRKCGCTSKGKLLENSAGVFWVLMFFQTCREEAALLALL